jgi:hypothetical protein
MDVRRYIIYLIEEEVANSFFGQELLLYKLFLKGQANFSPQEAIIRKQIEYITKSIPVLPIHIRLQEKLLQVGGYETSESHFIQYNESKAKLTIHFDYLLLLSEGTLEAETLFFESLRQIESCFFAMDFKKHHFGWLNPIKTKKTV